MIAVAEPRTNAAGLAPDLRIRDILDTLPREVFRKDWRKAWFQVAYNVAAVAVGYWAIAQAPLYLLPLAWIWTGTALTGFFVLGHDCGHRSFSNKLWVNDLVGHLAFLPLLYPFHGWRLQHDHHHKHTNKMEVDNAWHPATREKFLRSGKGYQALYHALRGRLWFLASIAHWAKYHFTREARLSPKQQQQMRFSAAVVILAAIIGLPLLVLTTGWFGLVKFWLMPWLVYHFWMSTFTIVHHTLPEIPFKYEGEWQEAHAQLAGTVHCDYPRWVEVLCHDINVHVPHHLSTAIPSYNLRKAHASLRQNWGPHLVERTFNWPLMKQIVDRCHIYDPVVNYRSIPEIRG